MGLILNKHGVGPTEEKVKAIRETKAPTNVAELRSFLGLVSFSARFLPDFATTVEPLRKLTRQARVLSGSGAKRKIITMFNQETLSQMWFS